MQKTVAILLLLIILAGTLLPAAGQGSTTIYLPLAYRGYDPNAQPPPTPVPPRLWSPYGLQAAANQANQESLSTSGATWVRPSLVVNWAAVEPVEGQRDWSALADLESALQNLAANGLWPLVTVTGTPSWAQQVSGLPCGPVKPAKLGAFANFLRDLVQRYSAPPYQVHHWLLWDEIDDPGCWGDPSQSGYGGTDYAAMLQQAYPAIHAADGEAQVILGGLKLDCKDCQAATFIEGVMLGGGGGFFDGVGYYASDDYAAFFLDWGETWQYASAAWGVDWLNGGPSFIPKRSYLAEVIGKYDTGGKSYLVLGYSLRCDECGGDLLYRQAQAGYLAQVYALSGYAGMEALVWDDLESLSGPDDIPQYPADLPYYAYQFSRQSGPAAGEYLGRVKPGEVGGYADIQGYKYSRGSGEVWVLWLASAESGSRNVTFTSHPSAVFNLVGDPLPANPLAVGVSPLYVIFDK